MDGALGNQASPRLLVEVLPLKGTTAPEFISANTDRLTTLPRLAQRPQDADAGFRNKRLISPSSAPFFRGFSNGG